MADPKTVTAPPAEPNSPEGSTAGWVNAPESCDRPVAAAATTQTQEAGPTPGPGHPERRTDSDDTERIDPDIAEPAKLPAIPGFRVEKVIGYELIISRPDAGLPHYSWCDSLQDL